MITLQDIQEAHDRIRPYIHRTPVFTNETINKLTGASIYFKCENFQKIGAFKARGGLNAVLQIIERQEANSLTTHSSGNHAQALAYAAKKVGLPAYIVMPRTAPQVKQDAVRSYGAQIIECDPTLEAREEGVRQVMASKGAVLVHPFDNDRVITGQATAAKELIEDLDTVLDAMVAPVGGGGLLSGSCLAAHYFSPSTSVFGAEPEGAADAIYSLKSGVVEKPSFINTIADGLLTTLSERTLAIIHAHVKDIYLVSDQEITQAMKMIWERMKIIVEPSAAVALAAVIKNKEFFAGQKVGIILSGGNVDLAKLPF
ncbi:pyridoxal-phosphate dependent enzyme [Rhodocytophaga rosea]|uniref:Pyridoxal-phosphate dependent enzyme n=1 Tax=Rhodocytophaga rosea TaxID=2704465 RepID=A0A6C0GEI6_9BACT|nr:pyridoxal-phosphate dependent enzyme [Rhodocytophaga rosea]QHT66401.1 pyridoxal-phosphate dependent enzyme [Rhodocytophaga rosea]